MNDRDPRKALAILAGLALALGAVGSTIAVQPTATNEVMTGHTSWMETSTSYDGCLAGIAGLILQKVTWFNGQTLFETSSGTSEDTWVYFTDGGLDADERIDPTSEDLFRSNETYEFEDPNRDHTWTVKEYYVNKGLPGITGVDGSPGDQEPGLEQDRLYIWAVNVSAQPFHDSTIDQDYNFVGILNTCKFDEDPARTVEHDDQNDHDKRGDEDPHDPKWQHDSNNPEGEHEHDVYTVDIWIGGEPSLFLGSELLGSSDKDGGGDAS